MLNEQTVGGLTVFCVNALTTSHIEGWHRASIIQNHVEWSDSVRVESVNT